MATYCTIVAERRIGDAWELVGEPAFSQPWNALRPAELLWLDGRDEMWTVLCGRVCRVGGLDHSGLHVLAPPRGLPGDLSPVLREWVRVKDEAFAVIEPSWLLVREILDFDWTAQTILFRAFVAPEVALWFGPEESPRPFPRGAWGDREIVVSLRPDAGEDGARDSGAVGVGSERSPVLHAWRPEGTVQVYWTESHAGVLGERGAFFETLRGLGPPDETRIVFWRDQ